MIYSGRRNCIKSKIKSNECKQYLYLEFLVNVLLFWLTLQDFINESENLLVSVIVRTDGDSFALFYLQYEAYAE